MVDSFDDIIKWYETSTGIEKKDIELKEIVRLRKLANMVNDGSIIMEELRLKSLIKKESMKCQEPEYDNLFKAEEEVRRIKREGF